MDTQHLKAHVNKFRSYQDSSGRVVGDVTKAKIELEGILTQLSSLSENSPVANLECIYEDIGDWLNRGLNTPPNFVNTAKDFINTKHLPEKLLYAGPMIMANAGKSRGLFFEFFFAHVDIPNELLAMREEFPHPNDKTVPIRFINATERLSEGNNVVFFPENIALSASQRQQNFAVFMFDKFRRIYHTITLPQSESILSHEWTDNDSGFASANLSEDQTYVARCLWGYIHDYFHYQGCRPIGTNLHIKMKWVSGLLEELKVDCQTALLMATQKELPYAKEIFEFILLERIFRYPLEIDAEVNFDSGTGVFLFNWLWRRGVFKRSHGFWQLSFSALIQALHEFVDTVERLEKLEDGAYLEGANRLVFEYLTPSTENKKFAINKEYKQLFEINDRYSKR